MSADDALWNVEAGGAQPLSASADMSAVLETPRVSLVSPSPEHYTRLRQWELSGPLAVRWRHRGRTPSPRVHEELLWAGVISQYLVIDRQAATTRGLVAGYDANFQNGYAHLAAAKFDPADRSTVVIEGCILLVDHMFASWPLRKLYMVTPEFNLAQIASGVGRYFQQEGRLREHVFAFGRYWDEITLALYRDEWAVRRKRFARLMATAQHGGEA